MRKKIKFISALLVAAAFCMTESIQALGNESSAGKYEISQQKKRITGTIEDTFGPVAGASIMVKGTTPGTISDMNGNYSLDVAEGDVLVVSFLGYVTQEIRVNEQHMLNITIEEDAKKLDEVVVTALGIKKDAKKLGYAMSTIVADDLVKTGTPNFASSLYGKASGVRIQAAPGGGSSAVSINVRGMNSISGTNQPLVVVDGIPIRNGDANEKGYWDDQRIQGNGLTDINPEDIETLSILKGASASALYGSEAANGVVLITTKSGAGKKGVSIDFNMTFGVDKAAYLPEIQTVFGPGTRREARSGEWLTGEGFKKETYKGQEYVRPQYETYHMYGPKYDGRDVLYWDGSTRKYEPYKNGKGWCDLFRTGSSGTYNLAITAGGENSSTRFSYTYYDEQRLQRKSNMGRHSFNLSGGLKIIPKIRLEYNVSYMNRKDTNRPLRFSRLTNNYWGMFSGFNDVNRMWDMTETSQGYLNVFGMNNPNTYTPDESFLWDISGKSLVEEYFWQVKKKRSEEMTNRLIGNVNVIANICEGLTLNVRLGTDYTTDCIENMNATTAPLAIKKDGGEYSIQNKRYEIYYGEAMLNYAKDFNETWGMSAAAGYNLREEKQNDVKLGTDGGLSVENWFYIDASVYGEKKTEMKKVNFIRQAFFGMAGVGFKNYLFLEGTVRSEKSSTLLSGENTYTYPSGNLSFLLSEALGDKKPVWVDYLKARASYGIVGNAPEVYKASFAYKQDVISGFIYNQMQEELPNAKLKPEKKHETEFGLEGKFFHDRLGFEATYYTNVIKDQILKTSTSWSQGAKSMWENVGELQNQGWEFSLYGTPVRTRNFQWDIRANLSFNKNKVNKLMNGIDELQHSSEDGGAIRLVSKVGGSAGDIMGYMPLEMNGQPVVGENGLYIIDKSEYKKLGNTSPDAVGGITTSFSWKNFFVDMGVDFSIGGDVVNKPYQYMMELGYLNESLKYRDAAHGGMTYHYADPDDFNSKKIAGASTGKTYDDGMILPGVKEDGTPNDVIVSAETYYANAYGWGALNTTTTYKNSVFDNSYVKMRELTLGYTLPREISSKFACKHLSVSLYGRNLFYFYKNLPVFDAEAVDGTRWDTRYQIGGSMAATRSFGISLRAGF